MDPRISEEQGYVDMLFGRLDDAVDKTNERLREVMLTQDPDAAEALVQRETEYHSLNEKLDRLNLAQLGLVFGRVDVAEKPENIDNPIPGQPGMDRRYIGRMGLTAREENYRSLLLDWRAPMARPFYLATTARPEGVTLRRHIRTKGREVISVDDEYLSHLPEDAPDPGVAGESALLKALDAARTGHMSSIVETIQREQDAVIRDSTRGVMVVEGGPGTGKTAVALHRVAWLLYTWREQLAATGVLIIGPNRTFLDYISHVLPELGETGVVLSTIGELYPGVCPALKESLLVREIKGSVEMATILATLVKHHQALPKAPVELNVDGICLRADADLVKRARTRARRSRRPHNPARPLFREQFLAELAQQMANIIGADPLGGNLLSRADIDQLHDDLAEEAAVEELVEQFWPELDPLEVLAEFFASRELIDEVASEYDEETRSALYRDTKGWAASDAALLDELATLIGTPDPEELRLKEEEAWRAQVEEAQDALDILSSSASTDSDDEVEAEILEAYDVIDAETLARRQEVRDLRSTAQRAREDHTWAYGHIIVDEAQELSPMEWRMVMRRSPNRWMTLVGDTAQTSSPAGVDSWSETLEPFVAQRFKRHTLTVNYRTPIEITEVANSLVKQIDPEAIPAIAIRSTEPVRYLPLGTDPEEVAAEFDDGRLVQIINVENVLDIKGLEFDHVIVEDPQAIVDASPQGLQDLYVAITRATRTLTIIGEKNAAYRSTPQEEE